MTAEVVVEVDEHAPALGVPPATLPSAATRTSADGTTPAGSPATAGAVDVMDALTRV